MSRTYHNVVSALSVGVGLLRIYQSIYDRPAGSQVSMFGLAAGLSFVALGVWFYMRGKRRP